MESEQMEHTMLDPNTVVRITDISGGSAHVALQDAWGFASKRSWDHLVRTMGGGDERSIPKRWEADHDERYRIWKETGKVIKHTCSCGANNGTNWLIISGPKGKQERCCRECLSEL